MDKATFIEAIRTGWKQWDGLIGEPSHIGFPQRMETHLKFKPELHRDDA